MEDQRERATVYLEDVLSDADLLSISVCTIGVGLVPSVGTVTVSVTLPSLGNTTARRTADTGTDHLEQKKSINELVLGAGLVHTEEFVLVGLVSAVVVAVAEIGRLDTDVRVGTADLDSSAVDGQTGTGVFRLVGYRGIVAVVVSITDLRLVDAVSIPTSKHPRGTGGRLGTVQLVRGVSAVVDVVALLGLVDTPSVGTQEVILGTGAGVAIVGVLIRAVGTVRSSVAGDSQRDTGSGSTLEGVRGKTELRWLLRSEHALGGIVLNVCFFSISV